MIQPWMMDALHHLRQSWGLVKTGWGVLMTSLSCHVIKAKDLGEYIQSRAMLWRKLDMVLRRVAGWRARCWLGGRHHQQKLLGLRAMLPLLLPLPART